MSSTNSKFQIPSSNYKDQNSRADRSPRSAETPPSQLSAVPLLPGWSGLSGVGKCRSQYWALPPPTSRMAAGAAATRRFARIPLPLRRPRRVRGSGDKKAEARIHPRFCYRQRLSQENCKTARAAFYSVHHEAIPVSSMNRPVVQRHDRFYVMPRKTHPEPARGTGRSPGHAAKTPRRLLRNTTVLGGGSVSGYKIRPTPNSAGSNGCALPSDAIETVPE